MRGIDLFAGAGGMSLGAKWAGIDVKFAVELHHAAARTLARNHPDCVTVQGDLRHIGGLIDLRKRKEELVVFGGPPCQAFSTSNQRTRGPKNEKNGLYKEFLKFIGVLKPEWVVFENVPGILEKRSKLYVSDIERRLKSMGYRISSGVLDAADFGVPQHRKRFFIIGALNRDPPSLPNPTTKKLVTVADAIEDLPLLKNGTMAPSLKYKKEAKNPYARKMRGKRNECTHNLVSDNAKSIVKRYKHIPQGGNWSDIPAKMMRSYADRTRCHTGIYHRLRASEPSVVIGNFRKNMLIHPSQNRGLSVREAARLQSFPDWYEFEGSIGLQQQQVGNAVPPLLAKAVFEQITKAVRARG